MKIVLGEDGLSFIFVVYESVIIFIMMIEVEIGGEIIIVEFVFFECVLFNNEMGLLVCIVSVVIIEGEFDDSFFSF